MINKKLLLACVVLLVSVICVFAKSSTVWSGSFDPQNWGAWQEINLSDPVVDGDTIVFKGDVSDNAQIQIDDKNWAPIDGPYVDFKAGVYKLAVTSDNAAAINGGIYVKGQGFTLKSVDVIKKSSDDDQTSDNTSSEIEYQPLPWSDSFDANNWNSQLALKNKDLKAGDKLIFTGTVSGASQDSPAQLQVATPDFSTFFTKGDWNLVDFSNGSYTLTVDDSNVALLDSGFVVKGQHFTLTSVTVEKAQELTFESLPWMGAFDPNSWNSVLALKGENLQIGDRLEFIGDASAATEDAPSQIQVAAPDFSVFLTTDNGNYNDYDGDFNLEVTADNVDLLRSGFVVKGQSYTLEEVRVISSISTKINGISGDHRQKGVYYNLNGQRMSEPKGICILQGKKILK